MHPYRCKWAYLFASFMIFLAESVFTCRQRKGKKEHRFELVAHGNGILWRVHNNLIMRVNMNELFRLLLVFFLFFVFGRVSHMAPLSRTVISSCWGCQKIKFNEKIVKELDFIIIFWQKSANDIDFLLLLFFFEEKLLPFPCFRWISFFFFLTHETSKEFYLCSLCRNFDGRLFVFFILFGMSMSAQMLDMKLANQKCLKTHAKATRALTCSEHF